MKANAKGGLSVVSGFVTLKSGWNNLTNGNYLDGTLQVGQGSLTVADGANDIRNAKNGLGKTAPQALKRANSVVSGGMAVYDTAQAYQAYKSGDTVRRPPKKPQAQSSTP